jgi:ketosteroid isomerase-like protein
MSTTTTNILDTIRAATEGRDAQALGALYADDAEVTIVDRSTPPGAPRVLHGHGEVVAYLRDSCAREMTHQVRDDVLADGRLAFSTHCRYPDGTRVLCITVASLDASGRIAEQTIVQAWDE